MTIGMLAGGLGLFMLAVSMITDGLKMAAGHTLRDLLTKSTCSPTRGIVTGIGITAIVQSSSAVTVATIGFVNAGLLTLYQALGIIYGSNIGTTMTGWLVAIMGFNIKVDTFALPLIGIGMLIHLTGGESRRKPLGLALAGFGLFFIGIDVLKDAFEGMATSIDLNKITVDGIAGVFIFVTIGFLITVFTQSSSAAIAIILSAATAGVLGLYASAAMVIGANLGTTSTAIIAVIGATSSAKRVAAAHVIFNFVTGLVALLILPILFLIVQATGEFIGLEAIPAITLALFHTVFNILGVLIMWPMTGKLALFLESRFVTQEEAEGRARYLDKTVVASPMLALNALALELSRIASVARRMALEALNTDSKPGKRIKVDYMIAKRLSLAVSEFITQLEKGLLSGNDAEQLAKVLRTEQHLLACSEQAMFIVKAQGELERLDDEELGADISHYRAEVVKLISMTNLDEEEFSIIDCDNQLLQVKNVYYDVKKVLLLAGAELRIPVQNMIDLLEQNSRIHRMSRQMIKAIHLLNELNIVSEVQIPETDEKTLENES